MILDKIIETKKTEVEELKRQTTISALEKKLPTSNLAVISGGQLVPGDALLLPK